MMKDVKLKKDKQKKNGLQNGFVFRHFSLVQLLIKE